jgi:hypothetical protein
MQRRPAYGGRPLASSEDFRKRDTSKQPVKSGSKSIPLTFRMKAFKTLASKAQERSADADRILQHENDLFNNDLFNQETL